MAKSSYNMNNCPGILKLLTKRHFSHNIDNNDQYFEKEYGVLKNAQVQLFTSIVKANNNQHKSIINEQQEYMQKQSALNGKLVQHIQQLNECSTKIMESILEQKEEFDRRGRIEKRSRLYTKQVINHMAFTIEQYDIQLTKQNRLIENMNENIIKQEGITNQFDSKINKQRTILRNIARKQSYFFEEIMSRLNDVHKREKVSINSQERILEMGNQLTDIMEAQNRQRSLEYNEMKKLLQKLLEEKHNISSLLASLPPNYPMKKILLNGEKMHVDYFLFLNESSGIAYFSLDNEIVSVSIDKVEAIYWGR